jgi:chromosome segregation ATPase
VQEENKILQEEAASAKKISEEREKQINELQTEKEYLLSELVQAASKRIKEIKIMTEVYEGRLEELVDKVTLVKKDLCMVKAEADKRTKEAMDATEMNKCLTQQLLEAQNKISEQEHSIAELTCEKERLAADLWKIVDSRSKLIRHNEHLADHLVDLENESCPLKLQPQELSAELEEKTHFCKDFTDLEHRIANLEIAKEEVTADVNVQLERINAIAERLSELDTEEEKLHCEQQGVAAICDQQGNALIETVNELTSLEERLRKDYLMEGDAELHNNSEADNLKAAVNELAVYMESCRMRISEINQRRKEITEEKSVLMQQQSHALERKNEYVKY